MTGFRISTWYMFIQWDGKTLMRFSGKCFLNNNENKVIPSQKNYIKNISMIQITMMVWTTHLEPDILEWEIKWALVSISTNKASGCDGIPDELFRILRDDAVKVLHVICQQIWKNQQWPRDWKRSVFIPIPKKGNAKECSNYCIIVLISYTG